jgi:hypothetical protein
MTPTMKPRIRGRMAAIKKVVDRSGGAKLATVFLCVSAL